MGDNKSEVRAEALRLITERLPQRMALMGDEVSWALGLKKLPRGHTPPIWVRRLILDFWGITHARARPLEKITAADFAEFMGYVSGVATGGRVLLEHPLDTSEIREDRKSAMVDFQKRIVDAARPYFEQLDGHLAQVSPKLYRGTPETVTAFSEAQSKVIKDIHSSKEGSASTDVCFFLWAVWPEAKTASSVQALHEWVDRLGFIHCGTKNFEKICRKIGFRGSARGRKKNTVNSYSARLRSR